MKLLIFNGWAAGPETWDSCTFQRDYLFDYLEQMDGIPDRMMEETREAVLVGFSMGGLTALRLLLKFREKVKGLVLVSATPCMMEKKDEGWAGMTHRRREALKYGTQMMFGDNSSPLYEESNLERGLNILQYTDLRADLRHAFANPSTFPVHIFQSERDGIVRAQNATFLKEIFPQANVTMVPGGEHVLPMKIPQLIDAAVTDIISNLKKN